MDDWAKKRLQKLQAAAPTKRKKVEPFVKVPLWWIEEAAKATESPTTLVLIELLRLHWKTGSSTFPLPNGRLQKLGVSRKVKYRVLRDLEKGKGRLIVVERIPRRAPRVCLIAL
jgi:hypothetical protein